MIHFSLNYNTVWGESLVIRTAGKAYGMRCTDNGRWEADLKNNLIRNNQQYTFEVVRDGRTIRREWRAHTLGVPSGAKETEVRDRWIDRPANSAFWASAFRQVIFSREAASAAPLRGNVVLRAAAPEIRPSETLAVTGSGDALGNWQKAVMLNGNGFPWWETAIEADGPFEFKYVVAERATGRILRWEEGPNHRCEPLEAATTVVADIVPQLPAIPWRGAGVAIPVFSIRTEDSFGVGEFHDIKKLVDWAVATGQNFIQLLPVNDTSMTGTWQDSYPYNAVSSFALHPQFIHLPEAGIKADKAYKTLQREVNSLDKIDYEKVNGEKMRLLHGVFNRQREELTADVKYQDFVAANRFWLLPYAVFCCLRDEMGTVDWRTWGANSKYTLKKAEKYAEAHPAEVAFWCWIQFVLDCQLKDAVAYAHKKRVAIKGDLPIGVSPVSADAWTNPDLFNLDMQAGAPPDAFSADGQNWGFPTYNWDRMAEDNFAWWRTRLKKMSEYFDAYRIDHILGFFRIWEIPAKYRSGLMGHFAPALPYSADELRQMGFDTADGAYVTPGENETDVLFVEDPRKKGFWHPRIAAQNTATFNHLTDWQKERFNALYNDFFYHRHDDFWRSSAMRKLPSLLKSSAMLSCGEDLGMIPGCVASVMSELNILSLEIQRMPKDPSQDFADPAYYPYYCVCATGTHDTSPLRAWWEEDRALSQRFYNDMMRCSGNAPYFCESWVAENIVREHLYSPAMLAILPLQDYLAVDGKVRYGGDPADERINIPANPRHYWRWRMHLTVEQLLENKSLSEHIRAMISDAARGI
ncbi:MAG: 4-alpha-glucanotransferase [Bacteroidales bacterium]|nr:4-alpha-glucanotransferase [Bacteroidales bacterium]